MNSSLLSKHCSGRKVHRLRKAINKVELNYLAAGPQTDINPFLDQTNVLLNRIKYIEKSQRSRSERKEVSPDAG